MSKRARTGLLFIVGLGLVVYGAMFRFHRVTSETGGTITEVGDPLVIQATCIGGVHAGPTGLVGNPASWGDTAGKECPT